MRSADVTTAREYLRVSLDKSGRERSITEQQDDNRRSWPDLTFVAEAYSDVSISASRYSTKARGGYARLVADLNAGRFGADALVLWEASRGSRRVAEWVELIETCETQGVRIAVTTHSRIYDPANARDRRSLLEDAVDSEYDAAKLSARFRRASAANAAAGRPNGVVPYGYKRIYDPHTGALVGEEPQPDEAAAVQAMYQRVKAGHSLHAVARYLDGEGIRTRAGKPWTPLRIRRILLNHRYAGDRVHNGAVVGPAIWPPLVPRETWLATQRILKDPARNKYRPGRAKHLLSLQPHVLCRSHGCRLVTAYRTGRQYQCNHVRLSADDLDHFVQQAIFAYLARPENWARITTDDNDRDAELHSAREQVAILRAELDDLADQVGRGELSARLAARAEPAIQARLQAAEDIERGLSTPSELVGIISPGEDVAARWDSIPVSARRRVVALLVHPDVLGELRIGRGTPGRPSPVEDRVTWQRAES